MFKPNTAFRVSRFEDGHRGPYTVCVNPIPSSQDPTYLTYQDAVPGSEGKGFYAGKVLVDTDDVVLIEDADAKKRGRSAHVKFEYLTRDRWLEVQVLEWEDLATQLHTTRDVQDFYLVDYA
jgi:hypothetical protein